VSVQKYSDAAPVCTPSGLRALRLVLRVNKRDWLAVLPRVIVTGCECRRR